MSGTFSKSSRPVLSGTYFDFDVSAPAVVPPAVGRTVTLGITHNWGPFQVPTLVNSLGEFVEKFGANASNPDPGYIAVRNAFLGEGVPDFGGAGAVIVYRQGAAAAAKASKSLNNATPAAAVTLTAKYEGTRGNDLRLTTQDHAADATKNELIIIDAGGGGSQVLETYVYTDTDIADLVAQINANSDWVTATQTITGVALAAVTTQALTGGNDGLTLLAGDYTEMLASLEVQRFGVLSFQNLTDSTIIASVKSWAQGQNAAGRRFFTVFGGALDEDINAANTRTATLNDPDIINVGVGSIRDDALLDVNGNPIVLSTAQSASRVAGILANRGERMSLTFAKLANTTLLNGASASDLVKAYDGGTLVFSRASDVAATTRIEHGITSFITTSDATRPRSIFSVPRYVFVMHGVQTDLVDWADENIVGKSSVDDDTRASVLAYVNALLAQRQKIKAIQPGWSAYVDPSPPASDDDNFVAFVIAAKFGRSTEQVFFVAQLA